MRKHNKGFTLIELLVVIAIISFLSSIVLTQLTVAKNKAIDTQRVLEMKQIQNALEVYYASNHSYPLSNSLDHRNWATECDLGRSEFVIPELVRDKLFPGIKDPVLDCAGEHWGYIYASDGQDYKLLSHTESSLPTLKNLIDPAQDLGPNYCLLDGSYIDGNGDEYLVGLARAHFGIWTEGAKCWLEIACDPTDSNPSQTCAALFPVTD